MIALLLLACTGGPVQDGLSVDQVAAYVRKGTSERVRWAQAVRDALETADRPTDEQHVCQVLAVIEQESGYEADPTVPGLADIAVREIETRAKEALGMLGDDAVGLVLDVKPEGAEHTFRERLRQVRTERDLDRVYRELVDHHASRAQPVAVALQVVAPKLEERLNPVSTAGSMQVKVDWSQAHPVSRGREREAVREHLYTVEGGVLYGTLRLFDHDAAYAEPVFRFADFNAGQYASRNAAFQTQLARLSGREVAPDGDLMAYNGRGKPLWNPEGQTASALLAWAEGTELTADRIRRDLAREKSAAFEQTATWHALKQAYQEAHGDPDYARVPDVTLDSPKLSGKWTTRSFAERVQRRYADCLKRA